LLGLAFHPQYSQNRRFFVYYTRAGDGAIQIAEYQVSASNPNVAETAEKVIITIPHPTFANHTAGPLLSGRTVIYTPRPATAAARTIRRTTRRILMFCSEKCFA
jgi:hypothetical protein